MFADTLKKLRTEQGLSMNELVNKYNNRFNGRMNRSTLSRYESGKQAPSYKTACNLAELFGVSADFMFGRGVKDGGIPEAVEIPIYEGALRSENVCGYEDFCCTDFEYHKFIAIKISDASMSPRFNIGDIAIIHIQKYMVDGDIAVFSLNNKVVVIRKISKVGDDFILVPFNPSFEVLRFTVEDLESRTIKVIGKVVELRAKF